MKKWKVILEKNKKNFITWSFDEPVLCHITGREQWTRGGWRHRCIPVRKYPPLHHGVVYKRLFFFFNDGQEPVSLGQGGRGQEELRDMGYKRVTQAWVLSRKRERVEKEKTRQVIRNTRLRWRQVKVLRNYGKLAGRRFRFVIRVVFRGWERKWKKKEAKKYWRTVKWMGARGREWASRNKLPPPVRQSRATSYKRVRDSLAKVLIFGSWSRMGGEHLFGLEEDGK